MLAVRDLWSGYGSQPVLQGVSFEIPEGEMAAIVGPNGAGKTTLVHTLMGILKPWRGSVEWNRASLGGRRPESIVRSGIAMVPEGRRIFATLTVRENLLVGTTPIRDKSAIRDELAHVLKRFPLLADAHAKPAGLLSGGQQQQLAIARALLSRPQLLLLDEPSLGLAPIVVDDVFTVIEELRESGTAILLVEQQALRAVLAADRSYLLRSGRMTRLPPRSSMTSERLAALYLGSEDVQEPAQS